MREKNAVWGIIIPITIGIFLVILLRFKINEIIIGVALCLGFFIIVTFATLLFLKIFLIFINLDIK